MDDDYDDKIYIENQNMRFLLEKLFSPRKSCCLWGNVEKYSAAGQATDNNMVHVHCTLDT